MHFHKINIPKKYLKVGAWVLAVILLLGITAGVLAYSKRDALLDTMISKAIGKAKSTYGLDLKIGEYRFNGFSTVQMIAVSVVPNNRDTLLKIKELSVGVKLFPLLFGNVKLSKIALNGGDVKIVFKDSLSNLDFILKRKRAESEEVKTKINLANLAHDLLSQLLYKIPDDMELSKLRVKLNDNDTASVELYAPEATIRDGNLASTINVNTDFAIWHINGLLNPGHNQMDIKLFAEGKPVELPYINNKFHARLSFDTIRTEMKSAEFRGKEYRIEGSWSVRNLLINHPKIASTDIVIQNARLDADVRVGSNYISLDSSSSASLSKSIIHPYLKYTLTPNKIYELKLNVPEQDAQTLLNALPFGLFESLEGLKVKGMVKYDLSFYLDASLPDSVKFNSALTPKNFKIVKWGKTNLQKINSPFVYTPYEYGKPMRDIKIGPSNPNFTPLSEVSSNFKNAILTSEDPSFFSHKGFVQESIRKSFVVNFKEKRFVRGGSTISMQLVKNVFLSRQKTLARKAEEILIVWLIENNRLISKNRMLEVYFNIIEMGQNVYGIGEASRYYFGKSPAELNAGEGIFLANIVPRPKIALYKFKSDGGLKDYLYPYFKYIGNIMARRGLTPPDTSGYGFYNVHLREGLRQYLLPDTAKIDTNKFDSEDPLPAIETHDDSKTLFDRLFGNPQKDTLTRKTSQADTIEKTRKEQRQERRKKRREERESDDAFNH